MSGQAGAGVTRMTRAVGVAAPRTRATGSPTGWCGTLGTGSGSRPLRCPRPLSPPTEHQVWEGSNARSGYTTPSNAGLPPSYRKYSRTILVESSQQQSSRPSYVSTICVQPQSRQSPHSSQGRQYFLLYSLHVPCFLRLSVWTSQCLLFLKGWPKNATGFRKSSRINSEDFLKIF